MMKDNRSLLGMGIALLAVGLACKAPAKGGAAEEHQDRSPSSASSASAETEPPEATKPKPAFVGQVEDLVAEYKANEVRADAKYKGKRAILIGVVDEIKKDVLDSIYVTLAAPDCLGRARFTNHAKCGIEQVQAFFEDDQASVAAAFNKGDVVSLDCTINGKMMNVLAKSCAITQLPGSAPPAVVSAAKAKAKKH